MKLLPPVRGWFTGGAAAALFVFWLGGIAGIASPGSTTSWENGFAQPPPEARVRAYWWWLNGNVTQEAITRDLEEMAAKGFGGALICDADGSAQHGNARVPHGPDFFSPQWRELYKHALREGNRLGLEMSLNIQSGWNLGGPMVKAEDAPKKLVWTETRVPGGTNLNLKLSRPEGRDGFYRDLFVLAVPAGAASPDRKPLKNLAEKALRQPLKPSSAPETAPLFAANPSTPGEQDARVADVVDLTSKFTPEGTLNWNAPAGEWQILRIGFTLNDHCRVSTCSQGWEGYALDPFDAGAFRRYWDAVVEPLIADAGPLAGRTLKYLHTDSWEVEVANWTPTLCEEFRQRRGYDLLPWLPVITGRIINSRDESNRFLNDFRRTFGDLAIDNHYRLFREGAHKHGLLIHPESGGPHAVPIDAQRCLGFNDAPMSEFWAWSWRHRVGDANRFFVKQPASAAHTYGHQLVLAEGFTTIGPHWQETLWDNLKPSFDKALTEGLNLLVWHAFVCSPDSEGLPGQQYFAGTHLNPNVTWWEKSEPFFDYLNRCQFLLQKGLFVADVAYYYGDHVPNFAQLKSSDPARILPGYDYDVVTEEVLLTRMSVKDGRLVLPDGMSYRVLVVRDLGVLSPAVLRKLKEFVGAGATLIGARPASSGTLTGFPRADAEFAELAAELWSSNRSFKGRVIAGKTARDVLLADGVLPDFEFSALPGKAAQPDLDYIHRRDGDAEIYFVANRATNAVSVNCTFRVAGKAPELWSAVTGERRFAISYQEAEGRTTLPLDFAPCGSWFVVFREPAAKHPATGEDNLARVTPLAEFTGPWTVHFDPKWGGPGPVQFDELASWTERSESGIRFYSGLATYTKSFEWKPEEGNRQSSVWLDLGSVRELAEVRVNSQPCGIVWTPPFRVNITGALQPGVNTVDVDVVNFWPNRIIGDASLPPEQRRTRTNIRAITMDTALMPSGLLGPVVVQAGEPIK
ncbi:MAG: glycoside hydrolase [Verrucomicrobia bacterium]|nr:glycoside hydrolase [Verrucomicrobiota bacterium]